MANSNNWGEIYKSTWWGDEDWSANSLKIDSAPPGFAEQNLLKASEDMNITRDWDRLPDTTDVPSVSANAVTDPNGGTTAERVDFTANRQARLQQRVTLESSKQYTFSVYAKVNTGTQNFRLRNVTLGDAESKTATTSWTRFSYTFTTTTAGDYDLSLQNNDNTARTLEFWGAMLNEGATAGDYVKTEASVSGSAPTPAYSGFGDSFGGVTAYYSLRQFTEAETLNAIRVRRSSDDTEQDIGFDANGDLDTTALTTFVNADYNLYTSDFTSGNEDLTESLGTGTDGQSVAGVDDAYKFTLSGGSSANHYAQRNGTLKLDYGNRVTFDYYIPSTNTAVDGVMMRTGAIGDGEYNQTTLDAWTTATINFTPSGNANLRFNATDGGSRTVDADGDVFYLKNIVVTQTTADGAVTTFYDQTGNGNNATNATASEQPLIVDGGSVAQFDGINSIEFDGTSHELAASLSLSTTAFSSFSVAGTDGVAGTNAQAIFGSNSTAFYSQIRSYDLETRISSSPILTLDDDIGNNPNQMQLFASINGTSAGNQYIDGTIGNRSPLDTSTSGGISETTVYVGSANGQRYLGGGICEIIIFNSDQSSNRTGMETNINDHFDIYP